MATESREVREGISNEMINLRDSSGTKRRRSCEGLVEGITVPEKSISHDFAMGKDLLGLKKEEYG